MRKVCIVEDDVDLTGAYQDAFESYGREYQRFEPELENQTAAEVAAQIARIDPAYVIIDACLHLEKGNANDGIEVLRCLRENYRLCNPLVLLVTNTLTEVLTAYKSFNCLGYLRKHPRHEDTATNVAQFIHTRQHPPRSPEHFFYSAIRVREVGSEYIDLPAKTFAKQVEGRWIFIPIAGTRPPLLLNEVMAQPGRWIPLDELRTKVAPGGVFDANALAVAANSVRRSFTDYLEDQSLLRPEIAAQLAKELPKRIETNAELGARWLPAE